MGESCCGTPRPCCYCCRRPDEEEAASQEEDACMCGCGYLHGALPVLLAQFLSFLAACFASAAVTDCSFVAVEESGYAVLPGPLVSVNLGLWSPQFPSNRTCYYYTFGNGSEQLQNYRTETSSWDVARVFAGLTAAIAWLVFIFYLPSYCCSSQVRGVRYFMAFFNSIVLTIFQGMSFLVFSSDFCQEYGCGFSRSAGFSVGALLCFFFAGICFLFMKDYPGKAAVSAVTDAETKAAPPPDEGEQQQEEEGEGEAIPVAAAEEVPAAAVAATGAAAGAGTAVAAQELANKEDNDDKEEGNDDESAPADDGEDEEEGAARGDEAPDVEEEEGMEVTSADVRASIKSVGSGEMPE